MFELCFVDYSRIHKKTNTHVASFWQTTNYPPPFVVLVLFVCIHFVSYCSLRIDYSRWKHKKNKMMLFRMMATFLLSTVLLLLSLFVSMLLIVDMASIFERLNAILSTLHPHDTGTSCLLSFLSLLPRALSPSRKISRDVNKWERKAHLPKLELW